MNLSTKKSCPFCGGTKLKLESKTTKLSLEDRYSGYKSKFTGSIRCNICHSRGPTCTIKLKTNSMTNNDLETLSQIAFDAWNNRA